MLDDSTSSPSGATTSARQPAGYTIDTPIRASANRNHREPTDAADEADSITSPTSISKSATATGAVSEERRISSPLRSADLPGSRLVATADIKICTSEELHFTRCRLPARGSHLRTRRIFAFIFARKV